jgi:hypothetical protein
MRLIEMEEQLAELQRLRELKRTRDRARRKKKLEYNSAKAVQCCFTRFMKRRNDGASDCLVAFLRAQVGDECIKPIPI